MGIKVSYTKYSFRPTNYLISEQEFNNVRPKLLVNPEFKFYTSRSLWVEFNELKLLIMIITVSALFVLVLVHLPKNDYGSYFGMGVVFFFVFSVISFLRSAASYFDYRSERSKYYSLLKKDIIDSSDYRTFYYIRTDRFSSREVSTSELFDLLSPPSPLEQYKRRKGL
jgi:hypothetical protein